MPETSSPSEEVRSNRIDFNQVFTAAAPSAPLRRVMRQGLPDLPDWALTFNFVPAVGLEELAEGLDLQAGQWLLDLACGMGGPGLLLTERCGAALVGIDFAESAVSVAAQTARRRRLPASYLAASGDELPVRAHCFDAAVCVDALRFIPGLGLPELHRTIRPGGKLGITAWASPADGLLPGLDDPEAALRSGGFRVVALRSKPEWIEAQRRVYESAIEAQDSGETDPAVVMMADEGRLRLDQLNPAGRFMAIAERI